MALVEDTHGLLTMDSRASHQLDRDPSFCWVSNHDIFTIIFWPSILFL
jgi:hypothetical protein